MNKRDVYIFGNPDLEIDSLPVRLIPDLQKLCPNFNFILKDPNEEWDIPEEMLIIDSALGLEKVTIFDDLESFASTPKLSMHDFDALTNLRYMQKLGKLKKIKIIALPPEMEPDRAIHDIENILISKKRAAFGKTA